MFFRSAILLLLAFGELATAAITKDCEDGVWLDSPGPAAGLDPARYFADLQARARISLLRNLAQLYPGADDISFSLLHFPHTSFPYHFVDISVQTPAGRRALEGLRFEYDIGRGYFEFEIDVPTELRRRGLHRFFVLEALRRHPKRRAAATLLSLNFANLVCALAAPDATRKEIEECGLEYYAYPAYRGRIYRRFAHQIRELKPGAEAAEVHRRIVGAFWSQTPTGRLAQGIGFRQIERMRLDLRTGLDVPFSHFEALLEWKPDAALTADRVPIRIDNFGREKSARVLLFPDGRIEPAVD